MRMRRASIPARQPAVQTAAMRPLLALALLLAVTGCARIPMADEANAWGYETRYSAPPHVAR